MFKVVDSFVPGLVSVVIPTYNRSELVLKAIDSVLNQTYKSVEIIVVDDCSTDDTILVLSKYGENIRLVKNEVNSYVGFARNVGVSMARGEYVAFLDSDDIWLPQKLELQMSWMKENHFDISVTGFYTFNSNLGSLELKNRPYKLHLRIVDILYGVFVAPGSTLVIKKNLFTAIGGYNITYRRLEDWDLLIRILLESKVVGFLNVPTAHIFAANEYTVNNLEESSKKLFYLNYKALWKKKFYYIVILIVGLCFELFVAELRRRNYFKATVYFVLVNVLSFFKHPYFRIHGFRIKKRVSG